MKNQPAFKTTNLTKKYKEKVAVDQLNLEVEEGELFALLGVNGAGKTTTIRMLTCLSTPTSGEAEIFGHSVTGDPDVVKAMVGVSPQDTAVADNLTVVENLRFMAEIYGKDGRESADRIIEDFGLTEVRDKKARTLSGGWKRRLSIAMAIIGDPRILFLDEPTLGLDVLARRELWSVIRKLRKRMTIILTTHYMEEAEELADRIGIMMNGRLVRLGTMPELEADTGVKGLEQVFVTVAEKEGVYHV